MSQPDLAGRLNRLKALEQEILEASARSIGHEAAICQTDLFLLGALRRTLAQSRGFRDLMTARNFPCAAAILRLQIDTAMRVNALTLVDDVEQTCGAVLRGDQFNRLKDRSRTKMSDAHLRRKLAGNYPWTSTVYEQTSGFVHLSDRHFLSSIAGMDEANRSVRFQIGGEDPPRPDADYFEVVDAFTEATSLAGKLIVGILMFIHGRTGGANATTTERQQDLPPSDEPAE
ncbi:MAG: hypothetical protein J0H82_26635 [Alphaproteobacteria bacterium]|nr:hypothetical protein [Alphaproteobacteria bacterium]